MKKISLALGALALVFSVAGCGSNYYDSPKPNIVVSVPAYAALVKELEGVGTAELDPFLDVQVLLGKGNLDPHGYEPSAKDRLLLANADLVIYAGTEADIFMEPLLDSVNMDPENVIRQIEYPGVIASHGLCVTVEDCANSSTDNPHLWYELISIGRIAPVITERLIKLNPSCTSIYKKALKGFQSRMATVLEQENKIWKSYNYQLKAIYAPENIANRFLSGMGLYSATPKEITNKLANDVELSTAEMLDAKKLISSGEIILFVANAQVESAQSKELADYAASKSIPVITFSEMEIANLKWGQNYHLTDQYLNKIEEVAKLLGVDINE